MGMTIIIASSITTIIYLLIKVRELERMIRVLTDTVIKSDNENKKIIDARLNATQAHINALAKEVGIKFRVSKKNL